MVVYYLELAPRSAKKEGKIKATQAEENKSENIITGHINVAGGRLKGFVDWLNITASDLAEEREEDMSSLVVEFASHMRKRAVSSQRKNTPRL